MPFNQRKKSSITMTMRYTKYRFTTTAASARTGTSRVVVKQTAGHTIRPRIIRQEPLFQVSPPVPLCHRFTTTSRSSNVTTSTGQCYSMTTNTVTQVKEEGGGASCSYVMDLTGQLRANHLVWNRRCYSTSRPFLDADKGNNNPDSTGRWRSWWLWNSGSSSTADNNTTTATTTTQRAKEIAKTVVSKTMTETQKLTEQATNHVTAFTNDTIQRGTQALEDAVRKPTKTAHVTSDLSKKATETLSPTAAETVGRAATSLSQSVGESLTRATQSVTTTAVVSGEALLQKTRDAAKQSVDHVVETTINRPIRKVSSNFQESSKQVIENITSSGTKLLRWLWWWSLAAIAVYAVATTLPIALIKYVVEQRRNNQATKSNSGDSGNNSEHGEGTRTEEERQDHAFTLSYVGSVVWNWLSGRGGEATDNDVSASTPGSNQSQEPPRRWWA